MSIEKDFLAYECGYENGLDDVVGEQQEPKICKECTHYSCGNQLDGMTWEKCDWNWECKSYWEDHFKVKDN
jgi:hypothetical protein